MNHSSLDFTQLALQIKQWGQNFGFQKIGITDIDLKEAEPKLQEWLRNKYHGTMTYMEKHGPLRTHPDQLLPGTIRIIMAQMNYLPADDQMVENLADPNRAYISRYALGRDYHKILRKRLAQLAQKITTEIGPFQYRAFADSAPVLEKPLAAKAGLGWQGKHTILLNRESGSWFFLGTLFTDLPLPVDAPVANHCGRCQACMQICPTNAIIAPYILDARRCISYLTIEYKGSIPEDLRPLIGNRIFGCDDCQIVCPWNRFAKVATESGFTPRHQLKTAQLLELFAWSEEEYVQKTEGSPLKRAGYDSWLRNIAIALGNAPASSDIMAALQTRYSTATRLVQEHIKWAITQQTLRTPVMGFKMI